MPLHRSNESARVLVAGIGNIFLGDDAFGVEVARRLASETLPEGVRVLDIGLRSLHLAYELLEGDYEVAILVDAVSRGDPPGTLSVLEPDHSVGGATPLDAHGVRPDHVLTMLRMLGGRVGRVLVVACEAARIGEDPGLSEHVAAAVSEAAELVLRIANECISAPQL